MSRSSRGCVTTEYATILGTRFRLISGRFDSLFSRPRKEEKNWYYSTCSRAQVIWATFWRTGTWCFDWIHRQHEFTVSHSKKNSLRFEQISGGKSLFAVPKHNTRLLPSNVTKTIKTCAQRSERLSPFLITTVFWSSLRISQMHTSDRK